MKLKLPSFRLQIILLVVFLLINSAMFFRNYFLDSFRSYSEATESFSINEQIRQLYDDHNDKLEKSGQTKFKDDIEKIMSVENQKSFARELFEKEIALYSKFIFIILTITVVALFLVSFYFITRPLRRLQLATDQLATGNLEIQVPESRFSPLNDLIQSFNSMTGELQSNRAKLIQAEKESAWRDMARVLAHEIKNPLTPIRLSLERLEMKYAARSKDLDKVFSSVTSVIHEEIDNLQSFASEFSRFARLPKAEFRSYDLNEQIRSIIEPYKVEVIIELSLQSDLSQFYADRNQIKQVFENIIQNSINAADKDFQIKIVSESNSSQLIIYVIDNGKGMAEDVVKEIFTPYFTKTAGGTGLGLAIVKRIVENHNGKIEVESEIGQGTKFKLSFPIENN